MLSFSIEMINNAMNDDTYRPIKAFRSGKMLVLWISGLLLLLVPANEARNLPLMAAQCNPAYVNQLPIRYVFPLDILRRP